jgi:hypothetical protein
MALEPAIKRNWREDGFLPMKIINQTNIHNKWHKIGDYGFLTHLSTASNETAANIRFTKINASLMVVF